MKVSNELIASIEKKTTQLIKKLESLQNENQLVIKQKNILETEVIQKNQEIKNLQKKIETLRITKVFDNKKDKVEAKKKINEILREIDKCVGLLNR